MPYKDPEKQREYQRNYVAAARANYLAGKCCVNCGSTDRLEIDHVDRSAKVSHRVWSWSPERRAIELAKCQVLCYTCHKIRTAEQMHVPMRHGTDRMYNSGCKCSLCVEFKRIKNSKRSQK